MSAEQKLKTLQSMCTHTAKNNGATRLQTSFTVAELRQLVGAIYHVDKGVVHYPHMWQDGGEWRTTRFELVPKA